ncbi:hypothetical protein [Bacillus sp. Marseille-P3661]|uniref:hypothetical protein n=1 Tax=Bacillus sp. Marseille-P3661 TaxID=1936234 RepID=UPI000C843C8B|nr:hypothetical protein [Bacillus sp. Marseille-P3661]
MKFTVHYLPLNKLKPPDPSFKLNEPIKKLQRVMWDCMNMLVVKKNNKDDSYVIVSGIERFEFLRKYTKNLYAPCIVAESEKVRVKGLFNRMFKKQPLDDFPMAPKSWSIVRTFLKQEPRFNSLTRSQQLRILLLGIRYKKTVIASMRNKVNQIIKNE